MVCPLEDEVGQIMLCDDVHLLDTEAEGVRRQTHVPAT